MAETLNTSVKEAVTVKRYTVLNKNGKKYLLLKFNNSSNLSFSGITLKVKQFNADGVKIDTIKMVCNSLNIKAKADFWLSPKNLLAMECATCEVEVIALHVGDFRYVDAKGGVPFVEYVALDEKSRRGERIAEKMKGVSVEVTKNGTRLSPFAAICAFLIVLAVSLITLGGIESFKTSANAFRVDDLVYAFENGVNTDGGDVYIVGYKGTSKDIEIPSEIGGHKVVGILDGSFDGNTNVTNVVINGLTTIDKGAFRNCIALTTLKLGTATEVKSGAFKNCANLKTVDFGNVTQIESEAFSGCSALTEVSSNKIARIGDFAFQYSGVNEISLGAKGTYEVIELGYGAFAHTPLNSVTINKTINYNYVPSGGYAKAFLTASQYEGRYGYFLNCAVKTLRIKNIATSSSDKYYKINPNESIIDKLFTEVKKELALTTVSIEEMDSLNADFFNSCVLLNSLSITNLKSREIAAETFSGFTELSLVEIPDVSAIGNAAFSESGITEFDASKAQTIGASAFLKCSQLKTIKLKNDSPLTEFGVQCLADCVSLEEIIVPYLVEGIPFSCFSGCSGLKSVVLNDSLHTVGNSAFFGCKGLTEITIPQSVTALQEMAFSGCAALEAIEIPNGVTQMGACIFSDCNALKSIKTPYIGGTPSRVEGLNYFYELGAYATEHEAYRVLEDIEITGRMDIGDYAFLSASGLKNVKLSGETTAIGAYAFDGCNKLSSIVLPSSLTNIGKNAFADCYKLYDIINFSGISVSMRGEENGAIAKNAIRIITSSDAKMTEAEVDSFKFGLGNEGWYLIDCTDINAKLSLPSSFKFGEDEITEYMIAPNVFFGQDDIEKVEIPSGVTKIDDGAFFDCYGLSAVEIEYGSKLTAIGVNAFCRDEQLSKINFPSKLETIAKSAFFGCSALLEVSLPSTLQSIGDDAFYSCTALDRVYNGSQLNVAVGFMTNGYVARYATTVLNMYIDEASKVLIDGIEFVETDDGWMLLSYVGNASDIVLDEFSTETSTIKDYSIADGAFSGVFELKTVALKSVKEIGKSAFRNCKYLTTVSVVGVERVLERAFSNCTVLASISFDNALISVGAYAFEYCSSLKSVKFGESLTTLGEYVFDNDVYLADAIIPKSANAINSRWAKGSSVSRVFFGGNATEWSLSGGSNSNAATIYYYRECIHDLGNYWRFDGFGNITTEKTVLDNYVVYIAATCTTAGKARATCPTCGHVDEKVVPPSHDLDEDGHCASCGKTIIYITPQNVSNYFSSNSTHTFVAVTDEATIANFGTTNLFKSNNVGIDNSTASMYYFATANCTIRFSYAVSSKLNDDYFYVRRNARALVSQSGEINKTDYLATISRSSRLYFNYEKDISGSDYEDAAYIMDIVIEIG